MCVMNVLVWLVICISAAAAGGGSDEDRVCARECVRECLDPTRPGEPSTVNRSIVSVCYKVL
jgi:hypothetical protein